MNTNTLVTISGRAGLVTIGLGTVAGTAFVLGAVVGLMLADLAPESGSTATNVAAPPSSIAGPDPAAIETADAPIRAPDQPSGTHAAASANVPATASVVDPDLVTPAPAAITPTLPLSRLPLDLGPRVAHALAALEPTGFMVQAGSFANERDARALAETIAGIAALVRVTPFVDADGRGGWQVAAGPFPDAATATAVAAGIRRVVGLSPLIRTAEFGE